MLILRISRPSGDSFFVEIKNPLQWERVSNQPNLNQLKCAFFSE